MPGATDMLLGRTPCADDCFAPSPVRCRDGDADTIAQPVISRAFTMQGISNEDSSVPINPLRKPLPRERAGQ
jgi:hypothetical protein